MNNPKHMKEGWLRHMVLTLLCVPFLLAQLIAPGTMAVGRQSGLRMVLCTGDGPVTVILTQNGDIEPVEDDGDHHRAGSPCAWSLALDHVAVATATDTAEIAARPTMTGQSWDRIRVPLTTTTKGPPARAPPYTV